MTYSTIMKNYRPKPSWPLLILCMMFGCAPKVDTGEVKDLRYLNHHIEFGCTAPNAMIENSAMESKDGLDGDDMMLLSGPL